MRTTLAYAVSVGLHGAVFGALAYAATAYPEFMTIQFAVRAGDANGAMSQPRWARHIDATFDTQLAVVPPSSAATVSIPAPVIPTPPEAPTPANLDAVPPSPNAIAKVAVPRTARGSRPQSQADDAELPRMDRSTAGAKLPMAPIAEAPLETTATTLNDIPETVPERVAMAIGPQSLVASAAAVTVQPLEPGNDDFDAIAANSPQGARVSQLPSRLPRNREPLYPEELRRRQIGGTVLLRVTITAEGMTEEVTLAKTSGYPALDESALTAVRTWRFEPARWNNVPVKYTVKLPVTFAVKR